MKTRGGGDGGIGGDERVRPRLVFGRTIGASRSNPPTGGGGDGSGGDNDRTR